MSEDSFTAVIQTESLKRCTSRKLASYLSELNRKDLKVIEFITPNVLVFQTRNSQGSGKVIERWLLKHFEPKKLHKTRNKRKSR